MPEDTGGSSNHPQTLFQGLTRTQLFNMIDQLNETQREELFVLMKALDDRVFYQLNPAVWMEDVLGVKLNSLLWSNNPGYAESGRVNEDGTFNLGRWDGTPDPINAILQSLARWEDVAVESATGTGKTFLAACIVLWFLAMFPGAKVITVAPKKDLLEINLWGEIRKLWPEFEKHYPNAQRQHLRVKMNPAAKPWEKDTDDRNPEDDEMGDWTAWGFVAGVSAGEESATKARGIHAEHMLFILEEMNGIPPAVLEAIENTCTSPHNLRLGLGNPNSKDDALHEMCMRNNITHITISAYDHPNVVGNAETMPLDEHNLVIPGAVSWKSILTRRDKYGPEPEYYNNHPLYKSMVRGICPTGSAYSLFTNKTLDVIEQYLTTRGDRQIVELSYDLVSVDGEPLEGFARIYEAVSHTHTNRYIIFADVAGDGGDGDWHAAVVFDRVKQKVVALIRMRGHRKRYIYELLRMGELYKTYHWEKDEWYYPVLCWERNAEGALNLDTDFAAYPNLYIARPYDKPKAGRARNVWGWFTSGSNRKDMIAELEEWGLSLRIRPWRVTDYIFYEEMRVFEWNTRRHRYEARPGKFDDMMMAMAGVLLLSKILFQHSDLIPIPSEPVGPIKKDIIALKKHMRRMDEKMKKVGKGDRTTFGQARIKGKRSYA